MGRGRRGTHNPRGRSTSGKQEGRTTLGGRGRIFGKRGMVAGGLRGKKPGGKSYKRPAKRIVSASKNKPFFPGRRGVFPTE